MEDDESSEFVSDSDDVQEDKPLPTGKYPTCRATPSSLSPSLSARIFNVQLR
jgi:hypothetical protein